jgi:hypothetical protein
MVAESTDAAVAAVGGAPRARRRARQIGMTQGAEAPIVTSLHVASARDTLPRSEGTLLFGPEVRLVPRGELGRVLDGSNVRSQVACVL